MTVAIGSFSMAIACAQNKSEPLTSEPAINFRVLQGWKVDLGDRAIFLNRVAPPILPPAPPPASPPTAEEVAAVAAVEKAEARMPQKKNEVLFLSATVHDHNVTEVRSISGGREFRFLTTADFNLLAGLGSIETADTTYMLILGVVNESREEVEAFNRRAAQDGQQDAFKRIPQADTFSKTRSEYVVAEDGTKAQPPAEILAALDALLAYYDAYRSKLAEDYTKREAARIAQERKVNDHPPVLKDTVIHYWKKNSAPTYSGTKEKP